MSTRNQARGNTLFIVIVLLLLVSLMSLYALNVGVFEQRTSGSDVRTKLVNEVAEAGLAQGMEYFRQNSADLKNVSGGKWVKCAATDTTFPCGSIVETANVIKMVGAVATPTTVDRRSTMYYWQSGGFDFDGKNGIDGWEAKMLPLTGTLTMTGEFPATYGVGAVLCRVAYKAKSGDPTECTDDTAKMSPSSVVTLVSVGALTTEGARATLVQTVGSYNIVNNPPGKPPIMAAGSVDLTGTLQVVTNPNGGGTGVPVSVWTRKDMTKTGTPNTCYLDEFLRYGAKTSDPPIFEGTTKIVTCDDCQCESTRSLSYASSGSAQLEGIDILDVDSNSGVNRDVQASEFPCDLFENTFGVKSWSDNDSPPDYFCETKIMTTYKNPNTGALVSMGVDEAFLYKNSSKIIPANATAQGLMMATQKLTGGYPSASLSGLVWCQTNCDIGSNQELGSPDRPVLIVIDGAAKIQGRVFGMVFLRSTGTTLSAATGGSATLDMNAGATVYGSIIVQGQVNKANGTAAIIYNADVLTNLANDPSNDKFGGIPGGWADHRVSY